MTGDKIINTSLSIAKNATIEQIYRIVVRNVTDSKAAMAAFSKFALTNTEEDGDFINFIFKPRFEGFKFNMTITASDAADGVTVIVNQ